MTPKKTLLPTLLLALLATPAQASPHVQANLAAAERYWNVPPDHPCAGTMQVIADPTLPDRGHAGEATGLGMTWTWDGTNWTDPQWTIERCEFTMDPAIQGCTRQNTVTHEWGHYIHGYSHEGPMSAIPTSCPATQPKQRGKRRNTPPGGCATKTPFMRLKI